MTEVCLYNGFVGLLFTLRTVAEFLEDQIWHILNRDMVYFSGRWFSSYGFNMFTLCRVTFTDYSVHRLLPPMKVNDLLYWMAVKDLCAVDDYELLHRVTELCYFW